MSQKIGTLAERLGTTPSALRFYEDEGLVTPPRSLRGTRQYGEAEAERFAAILALARSGVSLKQIQSLAAIRPASATGDQASHAVCDLLGELQGELAERRRALDDLLAQIVRADALVRQCFGCPSKPTRATCATCPVSAGLDKARLLALVWDEDSAR